MVKITDLLKMFGFERHLTSGGDCVYYKFHNKYMMDYYYDKGIKNKVLKVSAYSLSTIELIIVDEKEIIEMLFLRFKDQLDIIREIKLKSLLC